MIRLLVTTGLSVVLVGCASDPVVKPKYDFYDKGLRSVSIRTADNAAAAEQKARAFCGGDVFDVPEEYAASLKKQEEQRRLGNRLLDPVSWGYSCTPEGAWLRRWKVYGDEDSGKLYKEYEKVQYATAAHDAEVEYQRLRKLAKQKGVTSESRVLRDGSIISESYGNGRLCTGVSDEFGSRMSCEEVR